MKLAELQALFQRAILEGDSAILKNIPDSPREDRETLFGVYRTAYMARLVEILQHDFERLHGLLGDDDFAGMAEAYFKAHPSRHRNARWIGRDLPLFLKSTPNYKKRPVLAELAELEISLNNAFDAEDGAVIEAAVLATIAPEDWTNLVFSAHVSVHHLRFATNAAAIWMALGGDKPAPRTKALKEPQHVLVWRQITTPKFRLLGPEEAMMWTEAAKGVRFGVLCEMVSAFDDPDNAAVRAATYLKGWVDGGLLRGVDVDRPQPRKRTAARVLD